MYVAIDIGATNTRILITNNLDHPDLSSIQVIATNPIYEEGKREIFNFLEGVEVTSVSISFAGGIDQETGNIVGSTNLPQWDTKPLRGEFEEQYKCSVITNNDALNSALGELVYGETSFDNFIYLAWGTGLGAAIVEHDNNVPQVYRPEHRELLYELEKGIGGVDCYKKYGLELAELNEDQWEEVIGNLENAMTELSQSRDWGKSNFVIGGGVADKQNDRLNQIEVKGLNVYISSISRNSGLLGALAQIKVAQ